MRSKARLCYIFSWDLSQISRMIFFSRSRAIGRKEHASLVGCLAVKWGHILETVAFYRTA